MNKENTGAMYTSVICFGLIAVILWVFYNAVFGVEETPKQKEVSVILYHAGQDGWESFEEGVKQAEDDFSVNIKLEILREGADAAEQFEIIKREIANGAEGILTAVADYEQLYKLMLEEPPEVPVIAVESGFDDMYPMLSANNYEMGKLLGEELLEDFSGKKDLVIAVSKEAVLRDSVRDRRKGFFDAVEGKAKIISPEEAFHNKTADAIAALHKESLLMLSDYADRYLENVKCYGIGNSASVVAALDERRIEKLVFQNEFNMGYLAVESLLKEIDGIQTENNEIDYYCVSNDELYGTQYEQLLFPIVE